MAKNWKNNCPSLLRRAVAKAFHKKRCRLQVAAVAATPEGQAPAQGIELIEVCGVQGIIQAVQNGS
nr:hypothetical protein [uncultured bacterium]